MPDNTPLNSDLFYFTQEELSLATPEVINIIKPNLINGASRPADTTTNTVPQNNNTPPQTTDSTLASAPTPAPSAVETNSEVPPTSEPPVTNSVPPPANA